MFHWVIPHLSSFLTTLPRRRSRTTLRALNREPMPSSSWSKALKTSEGRQERRSIRNQDFECQLYQLYAEPDTHLEIIDADDFRVADHLAARTHVGRVKVQDDVDEKYYWKYIWWKILLKIYSMQNTTDNVSDEKYNWNSLYVRNNCASTKYLWSDTNKKIVLQSDNKLCNVQQRPGLLLTMATDR